MFDELIEKYKCKYKYAYIIYQYLKKFKISISRGLEFIIIFFKYSSIEFILTHHLTYHHQRGLFG